MDACVTNGEEKGKEDKIRYRKKSKEMCQCDKLVTSKNELTQKTCFVTQ